MREPKSDVSAISPYAVQAKFLMEKMVLNNTNGNGDHFGVYVGAGADKYGPAIIALSLLAINENLERILDQMYEAES